MILQDVNAQADAVEYAVRAEGLRFASQPVAAGAGVSPYSYVAEFISGGSRKSLFVAKEENPVPTMYLFEASVTASGSIRMLKPTASIITKTSDEANDWPSVGTDGPRFLVNGPVRLARFKR